MKHSPPDNVFLFLLFWNGILLCFEMTEDIQNLKTCNLEKLPLVLLAEIWSYFSLLVQLRLISVCKLCVKIRSLPFSYSAKLRLCSKRVPYTFLFSRYEFSEISLNMKNCTKDVIPLLHTHKTLTSLRIEDFDLDQTTVNSLLGYLSQM